MSDKKTFTYSDVFKLGMDMGHGDDHTRVVIIGKKAGEAMKLIHEVPILGLPIGRMLNTVELRTSELLDTQEWRQVRFPRSKKKRIRNKWAKRSENFKMVTVSKMLVITSPPCHDFTGKKLLDTLEINNSIFLLPDYPISFLKEAKNYKML